MFDYPYLEAPALREHVHQIYQMPPDLEHWVQIQLEMRRQKLQAELATDPKNADKTIEVYLTDRHFRKRPVFVLGYQQDSQPHLLECCYFHIVAPEGQSQSMELVLDQIPLERVFEKAKA